MQEIRLPWRDWEIVDELGSGSYGSVLKIRRTLAGGIDEYAAVKMITIPGDPGEVVELLNMGHSKESIRRKFKKDLEDTLQEYALMSRLKGCVNIVHAEDFATVDRTDQPGGYLFIKMELLTPLMKTLDSSGDVEAAAVKVGMDICSALSACAKHNVIHRDIKPENILVAADGTCKLSDFGVSKTSSLTAGGTMIGTFAYMAPEVFSNRPYNASADIYSLGLVLYWILNRRSEPFCPLPPEIPTSRQCREARERRFRGDALPPPADGSGELKQIVLKACAFDPKDRFASPEDMYNALARCGKGGASSDFGGGKSESKSQSRSAPDHAQLDDRRKVAITAKEASEGCKVKLRLNDRQDILVTIPSGCKNGDLIRVAGRGKEDPSSGAKGDLFLELVVEEKKGAEDIRSTPPSAPSGDLPVFIVTAEENSSRSFSHTVIRNRRSNGAAYTLQSWEEDGGKCVVTAEHNADTVRFSAQIVVSDMQYVAGKAPDMPWERVPDSILQRYADDDTSSCLLTLLGLALFFGGIAAIVSGLIPAGIGMAVIGFIILKADSTPKSTLAVKARSEIKRRRKTKID